jgi:hypothetical protein
MSQTTPPGGNSPRIEYGPNARDMIQIKEGVPYTVPANRMFVLTGLGTTVLTSNYGTTCELRVNGVREVSGGFVVTGSANGGGMSEGCSVASTPNCFMVSAGATIEVKELTPNSFNGRAWGYLAK